jgi:hypothetical protein
MHRKIEQLEEMCTSLQRFNLINNLKSTIPAGADPTTTDASPE